MSVMNDYPPQTYFQLEQLLEKSCVCRVTECSGSEMMSTPHPTSSFKREKSSPDASFLKSAKVAKYSNIKSYFNASNWFLLKEIDIQESLLDIEVKSLREELSKEKMLLIEKDSQLENYRKELLDAK